MDIVFTPSRVLLSIYPEALLIPKENACSVLVVRGYFQSLKETLSVDQLILLVAHGGYFSPLGNIYLASRGDLFQSPGAFFSPSRGTRQGDTPGAPL